MEQMVGYFKEVNNNQRDIVFIMMGEEYVFNGPNTKALVKASSAKVAAGLNHMLVWAYKYNRINFINRLNAYFKGLYDYLTSNEFINHIIDEVQNNRFPNTQESTAYFFKKFIGNIDKEIYEGIVDYVYHNIVENDDEDEILERDELFILTCIFMISKLFVIGVPLLESYKIENYLYDIIFLFHIFFFF